MELQSTNPQKQEGACMMVLTVGSNVRLFVLLLLLIEAHTPLAISGQQVDVSLRLQGVTLPNNSLVDVDDIHQFEIPANNNEYHDQALLCLTDLEDCCNNPRTKHGHWYYPNGTTVRFDLYGRNTFQRNRGANEVINGQQFYGSVRLFRRDYPTERGRFYCELPNAANPNTNHPLYVNILDIGAVTISPPGSTTSTAGGSVSLVCSASIVMQSDTPSPHFQWFFGPNNSSLSFQTQPLMTTNSGDVYTSTLQFSPLSQSHAGIYTCQLGGNARLAAHTTLNVNAPPITVMVTANFNASLMVGQTGSILTCDVSGADNLTDSTLTYRWARSDEITQTKQGDLRILNLSPLSLSHAGDYTCNVNVYSTLFNVTLYTVSSINSQIVIIQVPNLQSITVTSSLGNIVLNGSDVIVNCTVELDPIITETELPLLMVSAQLSRDGVQLALGDPTVTGTNFTFTTQLNSFGMNDSGNYTCNATIGPHPASIYLTGMSTILSDTTRITTGVYFSLHGKKVNNNSYIFITDIAEGDSGALLCLTDHTRCCHDSGMPTTRGQWFYPNGSLVGMNSDGQDYYVNRGPSVVHLNRRNNDVSISGYFCCEVPDATSVNIRICLNIVESVFKATVTTCVSEVAIGVAATISIECLLAAPVIAVMLAFCYRKRRKPLDNLKSSSSVVRYEGDTRSREAYEEPDNYKLRTVATTAARPGNLELTKCPAYVCTTSEPAQSSEYEYI